MDSDVSTWDKREDEEQARWKEREWQEARRKEREVGGLGSKLHIPLVVLPEESVTVVMAEKDAMPSALSPAAKKRTISSSFITSSPMNPSAKKLRGHPAVSTGEHVCILCHSCRPSIPPAPKRPALIHPPQLCFAPAELLLWRGTIVLQHLLCVLGVHSQITYATCTEVQNSTETMIVCQQGPTAFVRHGLPLQTKETLQQPKWCYLDILCGCCALKHRMLPPCTWLPFVHAALQTLSRNKRCKAKFRDCMQGLQVQVKSPQGFPVLPPLPCRWPSRYHTLVTISHPTCWRTAARQQLRGNYGVERKLRC